MTEVSKNIETLKNWAKTAEERYYFPEGISRDGSPYTAPLSGFDFQMFNELINHFGGILHVQQRIEKTVNKPKKDPHCGNWNFWYVLSKLDVARENIFS